MKTKKCVKCGKLIIKKPSEGMPYWKTKRFCSYHCSLIGKPSPLIGRHLPEETKRKISISKQGQEPWNKGKKLGSDYAWNYGLTKKTNKLVALIGKKSGASRLNKPQKPFRIINGYKCFFLPNHYRACPYTKTVPEQILVMEKALGTKLLNGEIVHHINLNKLDNRIENLMLLANRSEHMRWHALHDPKSGLKNGHQLGHTVSLATRKKISHSLKYKNKPKPHRKYSLRNFQTRAK